jgi:lipoyl(octanoyl) transferase
MRPLLVHDLGRRRYGEVLALQRELCRRRVAGELTEDVLLLVEHEPVITLGRGTKDASLPVPRTQLADHLARHGVELFDIERGGDVTFHGPGQLVGYPILDLRAHRPDLHWYLRALEDALVDALAALDVPAGRVPGLTGVWTAGRKIASIGIHVKQWVTLHGFALNVTTDLDYFDLIVPCGIRDVVMTSVLAERAAADAPRELWARTRDAVVTALAATFDRAPVEDGRSGGREVGSGSYDPPSFRPTA